MGNDINSKIREAHESGQMIIEGFENENQKIKAETDPEKIDEDAAERELFEKRKKKIDSFTLFGEEDDPYGSDAEKERIGELFDTHDDKRPSRKEVRAFNGIEYDQTKDARRVTRYLNSQKKKAFRRMASLAAIFALSIIISISSASSTAADSRTRAARG